MQISLINQGEVVTPEKTEWLDLAIENGQIYLNHASIVKEKFSSGQVIDASGCYVTPGLFDLQVNGSPECNLWAGCNVDQFAALCLSLLKAGVMAFLPTLITDDLEHLKKNIRALEALGVGNKKNNYGSLRKLPFKAEEVMLIPGIHLEGPYLSVERPGVHPQKYIRPIEMEEFAQLVGSSIKLITLAPEIEGGRLAVDYLLKKGIVPSLGHSNATFDQAMQAFNQGVCLVTHIFNALPPIHQRHPGAVLAALFSNNVYCCVIGDGLHVDPQMVKLLVKLKGKEKVILVTDMASTGTTNGELAGSSINLSQAVINMVNWGIVSFPEAIQMASLNPAKIMNLDHCFGQIKEGRRADLVVWDKKTLKIKHVIVNGCLVP